MNALVASLWQRAVVACCTAEATFATYVLPITSVIPLLTLTLAVVAGAFDWVVGLALTREVTSNDIRDASGRLEPNTISRAWEASVLRG